MTSNETSTKATALWHLSGNASVYQTDVDTSFSVSRGLSVDETVRRCIAMRQSVSPDDVVIDQLYAQN